MTQTAGVYAQALYDLAAEEGVSEAILKELQVLGAVFSEEPDFLRLLSAPALTKEERCRILDTGFRSNVHIYVLNAMKLLTEKGDIRCFPQCCQAYETLYNQANGILPVEAVTACPMQENQIRKLTEKLSHITGKSVQLTNRIDPTCLGGVQLNYDGKQVDGTVSGRLDAVRNLLKSTLL